MIPAAEVARLFDADTRSALASGLCLRCRGAKLLCGKARCPVLLRYDVQMRVRPLLDTCDLDGASPPGVFVGRIGYPKVHVGPLIPPLHGDTALLDAPERWVGRPLEEIVAFRSTLVRGMHRVSVSDAESGDRLVELTREIALATQSAEVEARFRKPPRGTVALDDDVQPFGPSAPLEGLKLATYRVDPKLDRAHSDTDLKAGPAILSLYRDGVAVSKIQRAFSVGAFGVRKARRFVPTRWSITAVDDTIGKALRERVKGNPLLDTYRVYEAVGHDDRFLVLMLPRSWRYELIEAWYPRTLWNPLGQDVLMMSSSEAYAGRRDYAEIGGCYYAARLAVAEALEREGRQAATVVLRETHPGYLMPLGVWNVREHVREALRRPPSLFASLEEALAHLGGRLDIPMARWIRQSDLVRFGLRQRTLEDFDGVGARVP